MKNLLSIFHIWLDKKLGLEASEEAVADIKKKASERVAEVTKSLKKQGDLQNLVIQRTTTYYIGKAIGAIK